MALTRRQQAFVAEFLVDLDGAAAARRAGYHGARVDQTAYENLRKPEISKAIQEAMKERAERTQINADDITRALKLIAFLPSRPEEITVDHKLRAMEMLCRHVGFFNDKLKISGRLSLEQLVRESMRKEQEEEQSLPVAAE